MRSGLETTQTGHGLLVLWRLCLHCRLHAKLNLSLHVLNKLRRLNERLRRLTEVVLVELEFVLVDLEVCSDPVEVENLEDGRGQHQGVDSQ
jgi:hypothetical protein